ncbi:MAG: S24 family peptidase [Pseudomonadota bacterium]
MSDKPTPKPFPIPVKPAGEAAQSPEDALASSCASGEPYALMVLGESMLPEFVEGEIIVVEPEGVARDGSYVIAYLEHLENEDERYIFRQLVKHPDGWMLKPLNPLYPNIPIDSIEAVVKGVVIMKKKPGRRRAMKEYV